MKFYNYINEMYENTELDFGILKEVDKKFFKETHHEFLYRGDKTKYIWQIMKTRKNRKPVDSSIDFQETIDKAFKKTFGWNVRSEGVFCLNKPNTGYGTDHIFFPLGPYKYVWSERISDLYLDWHFLLDEEVYDRLRYTDKKYNAGSWYLYDEAYRKSFADQFMKNVPKLYTDKNLYDLLKRKTGNEIVFKCEKYLLADLSYKDKIKEWIKENIKI